MSSKAPLHARPPKAEKKVCHICGYTYEGKDPYYCSYCRRNATTRTLTAIAIAAVALAVTIASIIH